MPRGVASSRQLAMMARVLKAYCERFSIPDTPTIRDNLAEELLVLFDHGFRHEEALLAELIRRRDPDYREIR